MIEFKLNNEQIRAELVGTLPYRRIIGKVFCRMNMLKLIQIAI